MNKFVVKLGELGIAKRKWIAKTPKQATARNQGCETGLGTYYRNENKVGGEPETRKKRQPVRTAISEWWWRGDDVFRAASDASPQHEEVCNELFEMLSTVPKLIVVTKAGAGGPAELLCERLHAMSSRGAIFKAYVAQKESQREPPSVWPD